MLVTVAAIVLYAVVAFGLAALLPGDAWPAIGDAEYSSGQATVVPALNVFAVGAIVLALLQPVLPKVPRIVLDVLLGIAAAAAGPALAAVSGTDAGIVTPGTLVLAAGGIAVALARTGLTRPED